MHGPMCKYIYIYIYMCVCVCVCVCKGISIVDPEDEAATIL